MLTKDLSPAKPIQVDFIEPMQISAVRVLPDGGNWTYEAKLDGYRCVAANRGGRVVLWSRRGTSFTARFPTIARACERLPQDTLIDAEVVVMTIMGVAHSIPYSTVDRTVTFSCTHLTSSSIEDAVSCV